MQCLKRAIKIIKSVNKKSVATTAEVFERLKYEFTLIKNYLQMAAARSQFNNHHKALKHGHKCIEYILRIVRQISKFRHNYIPIFKDFLNFLWDEEF